MNRTPIRIPGYIPTVTYVAMLAGTNVGWILGTLIWHWTQR